MSDAWLEEVLREISASRPSREQSRVLVVDDDAELRAWLASRLSEHELSLETAGSVAGALAAIARFRPRVVLVDKNLPDGSGLDVVRQGRELAPTTEFIVITGFASLDTAIEAINLGAFGYITKPFASVHEVLRRVRAALERQRVVNLNKLLADKLMEAQGELGRARAELEVMNDVVADSRRAKSAEFQRVFEELLEPLAVVEEDVGTFSDFAAEVAEGRAEPRQALAELGRLKMLEQIVRKLHARTADVAARLGRESERSPDGR